LLKLAGEEEEAEEEDAEEEEEEEEDLAFLDQVHRTW
jgi:hypothetical protein